MNMFNDARRKSIVTLILDKIGCSSRRQSQDQRVLRERRLNRYDNSVSYSKDLHCQEEEESQSVMVCPSDCSSCNARQKLDQ